MFTVIGFNENAETAATYVNIAGAKDQSAHVEDDVIYVPEKFTKVLWVSALGYDLSRAKLESPSIRRMGVLDINPSSNLETTYSNNLPQLNARYTGDCPISLVTAEGLEAKVRTNVDTTYLNTVGVCLGDAPVTPVKGEIWTVRATIDSLTMVKSEWANSEFVWDETLPVGRYQIVGAEVWAGYGSIFRFVPVGGMNRPGALTSGWSGQWTPIWQRFGNMGVWCEFHSTTPPSLEVLSMQAVATSVSIHVDLIKLA